MQNNILPDGWKRITVNDIKANEKGSVVSGPFGSNIGKRFFVDEGVPVIRGNNLTRGERKFLDDGFVFITEEKAYELRNCKAVAGDIVFTAAGTLGQVGIIPENTRYPEYVISNKQLRLRCNPEIADPEYLYYWFSSPDMRSYITNQNTGASIPLITLGTLRSLPVNLPPLPTQRRIASILSAYDDLIENNTRRIKILEQMTQAIYRERFVEFRAPGVKLRKATPEEQKATGKDRFPVGWEIRRLSSLVETQYGYTESASESQVGPKFVRGMDINKTSYIQWDDVPYCPITDADYPKYKLSVGDILVIRMADPGKVGMIEKDIDAVFASYLIRLRITSQKLSPYYLFHFLLSDRYQGYVTGASTGTTRKSASAGVITDIDIVIPTNEIRFQFEEQISAVRRMLNNLLDRNANLRQTRDLLLPRLMGGEIELRSNE